MNWLEFTTTLVNANVGITNDNLEIYEDEIFNSILANYDEDTSVGVTITETILLSNGVEIKVEYPAIKKDDNTSEPGKINVVAINKKVGK